MEHHNTSYCTCWKAFFPGEKIPDTDREYIEAIIQLGQAYHDDCHSFLTHEKVLPFPHPVTEIDLNDIEELIKKFTVFNLNLAAFCGELKMEKGMRKDKKRLRNLFETIDAALKEFAIVHARWRVWRYNPHLHQNKSASPAIPTISQIYAYGNVWEVVYN